MFTKVTPRALSLSWTSSYSTLCRSPILRMALLLQLQNGNKFAVTLRSGLAVGLHYAVITTVRGPQQKAVCITTLAPEGR